MSDLETIIDPHDSNENKATPVLAHLLSNGGVKSPMRKDVTASVLPPPLPLPSTASITNGNAFPVNKSLNGGESSLI